MEQVSFLDPELPSVRIATNDGYELYADQYTFADP